MRALDVAADGHEAGGEEEEAESEREMDGDPGRLGGELEPGQGCRVCVEGVDDVGGHQKDGPREEQ